MRNLKLQYCDTNITNVENVRFVLPDTNVPKANQTIYLITENKLCSYNKTKNNVTEVFEVESIIGAEYIALSDEICIATSAGEVLTVNPSTFYVNEGTFCDVGIECMAWSPDQEVITFVTKAKTVVAMTCTFDAIAEHTLTENCDGVGQFVNVGWGKKETQFHGSEGKAAAKHQSQFQPPVNVNELPQQSSITWRADSTYFAVSFVSESIGRLFKVFNKEGQLCYMSERINDLQPPLAWRPSGTWLAMPQRLPQKSIITLFEKNGLCHREIVLPFSLNTEPIVNISWSSDSDILMLETHLREKDARCLYFYTIGNYHWYLKQVLTFEGANALSSYSWDTRVGEEKTLNVMLQNGKYLCYV